MSCTSIGGWFTHLKEDQQRAWVEAADSGHVPQELIETLPREHRPGKPDQWVSMFKGVWTGAPAPAPEYLIGEELQDFLEDQRSDDAQ